ncbi:hypothetical protein ABPG72_009191 [Tetrahymena utriculariae]
MNSEEQDFINQVRQIYLNHQLELCIERVDNYDLEKSFLCQQTLQFYKMISLFELGFYKQANSCFQKITEERVKIKGNKIDSIDVLTMALNQYQVFYMDITQSEIQNEDFLKMCEEYKEQHQKQQSFEEGFYLLGKGIYIFIQQHRQQFGLFDGNDLEKAYLLLDQYKEDIISILAWCYYSEDKLDKSDYWGQLLYNINPKYPSICYLMAYNYEKKQQNDLALKFYLESEQYSPNNYKVLFNLAYYYESVKDQQKQVEYYQRAYETQPREASCCYRYGVYKYNQNLNQEAVKILQEGTKLDPLYKKNYALLAQIAFDENNMGVANKYLQRCIEISPQDGYYYKILGDYLLSQEQYAEAIICFSSSIEKNNYKSYKIDSIAKIGYCYYIIGDYHSSLEFYFNSCNETIQSFYYQSIYIRIQSLINRNFINLKQTQQIINKQQHFCIQKFQAILENIKNNNIKSLFQYKLDILREYLMLKVYKQQISTNLTFQSQYSHIDLYFD